MADGIFGPPPIPDDAIAACRLPNAEPAPVKFPPPVGGDFGLIVIASSFIWPIGPTGLLFAAFGSFFGAVMSPKLSTFEFNAVAHGSKNELRYSVRGEEGGVNETEFWGRQAETAIGDTFTECALGD